MTAISIRSGTSVLPLYRAVGVLKHHLSGHEQLSPREVGGEEARSRLVDAVDVLVVQDGLRDDMCLQDSPGRLSDPYHLVF